MEFSVTKWKLLALAIVVALIAYDISSDGAGIGRLTAVCIVGLVMIWFPGIYGVIWGLRRGAVGGSGEPTPEGRVLGIGWFLLGLVVVLTLYFAAVR